MNVAEAIKRRRTVRAFKKKPVPDELIRKIFEQAQQAPSNCNTQPWHVSVVSGDARDRLERALMKEISSGKPLNPAFQPGDANLTGAYKDRQFDCAMRYYATMGIAREDRDARDALMAKNWQFFGAPHAAFLSMPLSMGPVNSVDVGIYLQTLMLLLVEHGLGSCPQGSLAFFPDPVKEVASIPRDMGILCGLSFGYPDDAALINEVRMPRAEISECVDFIH